MMTIYRYLSKPLALVMAARAFYIFIGKNLLKKVALMEATVAVGAT